MPAENNKTIAIIGLGYVGLPLAVEFGKHRKTLGFDINQARIAELKAGQDHTLECTPEDLQSATQLRYSANMADLQTAQIFIVTVPTPVDQANRPDMTPLVKASETVGNMSFVGPRPALFNQDDLIALRTEQGVHKLVPGLTGWAQVNGRDELPIPQKVALDVEYLQKQSLWFDIRVLWLTFVKVVRRDGVSH